MNDKADPVMPGQAGQDIRRRRRIDVRLDRLKPERQMAMRRPKPPCCILLHASTPFRRRGQAIPAAFRKRNS